MRNTVSTSVLQGGRNTRRSEWRCVGIDKGMVWIRNWRVHRDLRGSDLGSDGGRMPASEQNDR